MGRPQKTWTGKHQLTLMLEALRDAHSIAALARRHRVSERLINRCKPQFIEGGRQSLGEKALEIDIR